MITIMRYKWYLNHIRGFVIVIITTEMETVWRSVEVKIERCWQHLLPGPHFREYHVEHLYREFDMLPCRLTGDPR